MKVKFPTEYIRTPRGRIAQSIISIGTSGPPGASVGGTESPRARSSGHLPKTTGPGFVPKPRR